MQARCWAAQIIQPPSSQSNGNESDKRFKTITLELQHTAQESIQTYNQSRRLTEAESLADQLKTQNWNRSIKSEDGRNPELFPQEAA
ncbi:MAG: hypothetical protein NTV57_09710 [Cyanobacteria bacterium]|nr:hypothetical protein [Cyanobacteriota bacterium]